MTGEKLIEVMARAICKMEYGDPDGFSAITLADTERTTPRWHYCAPTARAALAAIEAAGLWVVPAEPTAEMVLYGGHKMPALCYDYCGPCADPAAVWAAMLAASPLAKEEG